ncbi:hypothetical protein ACFLS9_08830, partial [Bacteroidota bacterium]
MKDYFKFLIPYLVFICMFTSPQFAGISSVSGTGEQKILVIMIKFPDVIPSFSIKEMQEKYYNKLNRYLRSISYDNSWIKVKLTDWYTLPNDVNHYHLSQHNLEVDNEKVTDLIQDAIDL